MQSVFVSLLCLQLQAWKGIVRLMETAARVSRAAKTVVAATKTAVSIVILPVVVG